MVAEETLAGLAVVAQRSVIVAGLVLLVIAAGLGLMAVRQRSQDEDPSDVTMLFAADTAEFPREHIARHRRPRSWPRLMPHATRRPVSRPRARLSERPTVRVWIFDPPEGRRG